MILRTRVLCGAILALLAASPAAALSSYNNLFVFGDSLVDGGNVSIASGGTNPNPASGYFLGRFANGYVASDFLNFSIEGSVSVPSLAGGDNFAFGGARTVNNGDGIPDLAAQVTSYLGAHGGLADPNSLYLINVGGNDVFDILSGAPAAARIAAVASTIATQISVLSGVGAQNFLVAGVGNVGGTPAAISAGAGAIGLAVSQSMTNAIFAALPASVARLDVIALFNLVNANPAAYGLPPGINVTNACLGSGTPDPAGPPTCTNYAFWDTIHPTTQLSQILGDGFIASVPEPGTALLLAFGLVGLAWRRRA